jgi:hypothetical protein
MASTTDSGIASFYQTATRRGFARTNLFRINSISRNSSTNPVNNTDIYTPIQNTENLFLYAQDGIIPSRNITVTSVDFKAFKYNIPMVASYPEAAGSWSVTFFCDRDYILRNVFEQWSVDTFDEHTSLSNQPNWWDCNIVLDLINNSGPNDTNTYPAVRRYTLVGAFLQNVSSMKYEVKSGGDIATMQANLGFQYITSEDLLTQ